jgi:hypothetical protein
MANQDVPWSAIEQNRNEMNPTAAGAFFVGSVTPLFFLLRLSRNHARKRK